MPPSIGPPLAAPDRHAAGLSGWAELAAGLPLIGLVFPVSSFSRPILWAESWR
ncbi:uncharacterized protein VDAG_01562 [Verticillium dahliae VdLs.17]|uniref:Uncharacterized protein n=1 Tax=Verticillium dahliae (strain VdLs.17 / ATCC MYA-4575 / FGSC 10137) TaxID=498257 RepID=G2WSF9_VERDV|nr:uncharacterized protein VDAG_01562 [Verticillium dahliae VdLs.17]EGY17880.1 hypothetical protein VDAG_01562 [Verticillium dahliae VdLs.17]